MRVDWPTVAMIAAVIAAIVAAITVTHGGDAEAVRDAVQRTGHISALLLALSWIADARWKRASDSLFVTMAVSHVTHFLLLVTIAILTTRANARLFLVPQGVVGVVIYTFLVGGALVRVFDRHAPRFERCTFYVLWTAFTIAVSSYPVALLGMLLVLPLRATLRSTIRRTHAREG